MNAYGLYVFDLDGTLYRGSEPIPGAADVLSELRGRGAKVGFFTNNSAMPPAAVAAKLTSLGFQCTDNEVATSSVAAANYCADNHVKSAFVVGESGLSDYLASCGLDCVGTSARADAVVAGICRSLTYDLIDAALQHIRAGARFIATNRDATYPIENGREQPGAGAIVAAIEAASGVAPIVVGKPAPGMLLTLLNGANCSPADCLVVGDREETDLACADAAGCDSALVLTGVKRDAKPGRTTIAALSELL